MNKWFNIPEYYVLVCKVGMIRTTKVAEELNQILKNDGALHRLASFSPSSTLRNYSVVYSLVYQIIVNISINIASHFNKD